MDNKYFNKVIIGSVKDEGNYELIKDIVGARVFYNNMSFLVEKKPDEELWNKFETNLYRNTRHNFEVLKKFNHYISDKFERFDLSQLGFILENNGIKSGVYFYGEKEEIIFLNITMNGLEEEAVGLADFLDKKMSHLILMIIFMMILLWILFQELFLLIQIGINILNF